MSQPIKLLRSPRYPVISLAEAITRVTLVYRADNRNKIPKSLVAGHMGYQSLNGKSLSVISAIAKYGLLDGGVDSMWVTMLAVDIIERDPDDPERAAAIRRAALNIDHFNEIEANFPAKASDSAIRSFLITKRAFLPDSAERLIRSYRETQELLASLPPESATLETKNSLDDNPLLEAKIVAFSDGAAAPAQLPMVPTLGEREWLRGPLSRSTNYRLLVIGDMGPKEIGRLIKLLEAQKLVLEDDDEDLIG